MKITINCSTCGNEMDAFETLPNRSEDEFRVNPCQTCLDVSHQEGYDEGLTQGEEDGREQGNDTAYAQGYEDGHAAEDAAPEEGKKDND